MSQSEDTGPSGGRYDGGAAPTAGLRSASQEVVSSRVEDEVGLDFSNGEVCASLEVLPGIDKLGVMWRDLEQRAERTFFLSWHWIQTWLVASGLMHSDAQPLLMVARRGAETVGLGLLHVKTNRIGPLRSERIFLHQAGDEYFDCIAIEFNDFLLDKGCQDEARIACLKELLRVHRARAIRWREFHWAGAPCDVARSLGAVDFPVQIYRSAPSPYVDLGVLRSEGRDYLEVLSRNTRYNTRRSMRLHEDRWGPLSIEVAASVEERVRWLEQLRQLHQAYWEAKHKPGAFKNPFFGQFLRKLIDGPSTQHVDLLRICAGDTPIGYLVNFVYAGCVMNYQSGFLYSSDGRYKPGLVSHALAVRHYVDTRPDVTEYSFLAGDAQYKRSLSTGTTQLNWYVIRPA